MGPSPMAECEAHEGAVSETSEAPAPAPAHALVCRLFLRLLGLVYLIAFLSLLVQVEGLIGSRGILPIAELLEWARAQTGPERYWLLPTLCWLDAGDGFLFFLCGCGAALAGLLLLEIAPAPVLVLLWAFYLSLVNAGQIFLGYQWDSLLLEAGFLAIFLAPLDPRPRADWRPSPIALWLLRWLLFRLMFSSGVVKLRSGDPSWRGLSALRFHYETQPLPTWAGWHVHQLPVWFHTLSCALMFVTELAVPFLVFAPRRFRFAGCGALLAFQILIATTGNYCFFNLLTIALCLLLLDDAALPRRWRERTAPAAPSRRPRAWPRWVLAPVAGVVLTVSGADLLATLGLGLPWPAPLVALERAVGPFRTINGYGLFAVMTTSRPEIVVEGSDDGMTWRPYEFKWKPGDLRRAPAFVAPHQPRLDWQMWFAALGTCERNPWFIRFLVRLQEGSPPVVRLLAGNPFPQAPPRRIRSTLYDYRFTGLEARRKDGAWWRREPLGPYCPELPLGAYSRTSPPS